ncbi:unnamed protein product [marine sediment metagenome]|uniref:IrrE N-terminal-like domain-containing protein n=1 Tax=marine sediment metagenome TaxID=412755 RepID=X0S710_9ZZZZ
MIKTHTFRGLRYRVSIRDKLAGFAEIPGHEPRTLYVDPTLSPKEFHETAIHEAMHAEDPDACEQVVNRRAKSLSRWLWRLGYRRQTDA